MATKKKVKRDESDVHSVRELVLWAENTSALYRQDLSIRANLARKMRSGKYVSSQAPKAWMYLADAASKSYGKEFGSGASSHAFSPAVRACSSQRVGGHV